MAAPFVKVRVDSKAISALRDRLAAVDGKAAAKAIRDGLAAATKAVLADARALVPSRTGQLRRSLGRVVRVYKRGRLAYGLVGPRSGFRVLVGGKPIDPVRYAHLVEYGRGPVKVKGKTKVLSSLKTAVSPDGPRVFGKAVGPAAPRPFLRPAAEMNRRRVTGLLIQHLSAALARVARGPAGAARRVA